MNNKRKGKKAAVVALTMSLMLGSTITASAVNNSDTSYTFNFSANAKYTDGRYKSDSSSCYMYYETGSVVYTASAYGKKTSTATTNVDMSRGQAYRFDSSHRKRFMYNYVKEWNKEHKNDQYPYLAIKGVCATNGTASGSWSPDSVSQAGVLPPTDYIK